MEPLRLRWFCWRCAKWCAGEACIHCKGAARPMYYIDLAPGGADRDPPAIPEPAPDDIVQDPDIDTEAAAA